MQRTPILMACAATIAALGGAGIAMNQPASVEQASVPAAIANPDSLSNAEIEQSAKPAIAESKADEPAAASSLVAGAAEQAPRPAQPVVDRSETPEAAEPSASEPEINDSKADEVAVLPPVVRRLARTAQAEPAQPYSPKTVAIRDEVALGSSFYRFRTQLRQAVRDRDAAFLQQIADENISLSFGRGVTLEQRLAEPAFWDELERAIGGDCAIDGYGQADPRTSDYFACPASFVADASHSSIDPYMVVYVDGTDVAVRQLPSQKSPVLTRVSNSILQSATLSWDEAMTDAEDAQLNQWYRTSETQSGWKFVSLPDGRKGFISSRYAYSALGYRAIFQQDGPDHWKMTAFIVGD